MPFQNGIYATSSRVLVVDDEGIIADTLSTILTKSGYEARAAYSGEMAIETARDFRPEMLITDVVMPGITGIEAAMKVRDMLPTCKVLLFSGQASTPRLIAAVHGRNIEFALLAKPVHPEALIAKMQSITDA